MGNTDSDAAHGSLARASRHDHQAAVARDDNLGSPIVGRPLDRARDSSRMQGADRSIGADL
jgi:hypothetical protein